MKKIYAMTAPRTVLTAWTETFQVSPGNGPFENAAQNWKPGDTIILAPGEYQNTLRRVHKEQPRCGGLTIRG